MSNQQTFLEALQARGISRRSFLKFCAITTSSLALSAKEARVFAAALAAAPRPTVIWLSFQQCTGCSESLLRAFDIPDDSPPSVSIENLILNIISLDYHETLQVAAGDRAEKSRKEAMDAGNYILIVDGSIPYGEKGETQFWSCAAGNSNVNTLQEAVSGAQLVIALGTCATFGGIPAAYPNPSKASGYGELVTKGVITGGPTYVNISGCPPMAAVITGTIAYYLANGAPALDAFHRPAVYYGTGRDAHTVHDSCPRLPHWERGEFAQSHGDVGARQGFCLLHLGCRGPQTSNACTRLGWNTDPKDGGLFKNSPTHSGHGCLGCSEPQFWDKSFDPVAKTFRSFYDVLGS